MDSYQDATRQYLLNSHSRGKDEIIPAEDINEHADHKAKFVLSDQRSVSDKEELKGKQTTKSLFRQSYE